MFKSAINTVFGHKQLVIATMAISVLGFYASADTMSAFAQTTINVPVACQPYCNVLVPFLQQDITADGFIIHFAFGP